MTLEEGEYFRIDAVELLRGFPIYSLERLGRSPLFSLSGPRPGCHPHAGLVCLGGGSRCHRGLFLPANPLASADQPFRHRARLLHPLAPVCRKELHDDARVGTGCARLLQHTRSFRATELV